jgi:formylglycine-generating enzyme required for sulfatase activity
VVTDPGGGRVRIINILETYHMESNPSHFKSGDDFPVENVSWNDAHQFIGQVNEQTGQRFGLPTEAQWEYSARSGGRVEKYAGGNDVKRVAWYGSNSDGKTHRMCTKAPNGLGIYDMSGNVWEWCEDVYDKNAYSKHARKNPVVSSGDSARLNRVRAGSTTPGACVQWNVAEARRATAPGKLRRWKKTNPSCLSLPGGSAKVCCCPCWKVKQDKQCIPDFARWVWNEKSILICNY